MVAVLVEAISAAEAISGVADTSVELISLGVTMGVITVGTAASTGTTTGMVDIGMAEAGTEQVGTRTVSGVIPPTMTTITTVRMPTAAMKAPITIRRQTVEPLPAPRGSWRSLDITTARSMAS